MIFWKLFYGTLQHVCDAKVCECRDGVYTSVDLSFQFIWKKKSRSRWSDLRFGMNKTKASKKQSIIDLTQTCLETCQSKHCILLSKINESKFAICKGFVLFPKKMKGDTVFLSNSIMKTLKLHKCTGSPKVHGTCFLLAKVTKFCF